MGWFGEWLRGEVDPPPDPAAPATPGRAGSGRTGASRRNSSVASPHRTPSAYPGADFGLPESGPDSVALPPVRFGQFLLDLLLAGLVASAFAFPAPPYLSLAVWAVMTGVPVAVVGRTPAMALLGLRVARVDGAPSVGLGWAAVRTVSLFFVVPAVVVDADARGLHDRVSRTIVLRTR